MKLDAGRSAITAVLLGATVLVLGIVWLFTSDLELFAPGPGVRVERYVSLGPVELRKHGRVERDFDGDGVADATEFDQERHEPLFGRKTSFVVRVRSGATRVVLAKWFVPIPATSAWWYGDADENGTDDVIVQDEDRGYVVLEHDGARR